MTITLEQFKTWLAEMREMYQREEEQAIRQRDMDKAIHALAGKDACQRLENYLPMRHGMTRAVAEIAPRKR